MDGWMVDGWMVGWMDGSGFVFGLGFWIGLEVLAAAFVVLLLFIPWTAFVELHQMNLSKKRSFINYSCLVNLIFMNH